MKKFLSKITRKHLLIAYFGLLMLILAFIGVMGGLGYELIEAGIEFTLLTMLVVSALVLGLWLLVRRMHSRLLRWMFGVLGGLLTFGLALIMMNFFIFMHLYSTPEPYAYLKSENGDAVVILRGLSMNQERTSTRAENRRAEDPEADPDTILYRDFGYSYAAYPRCAWFFYDSNAEVEGEIEIGVDSPARLMYEWIDGDTLRLYVEDGEETDFGEWILRMGD